MEQKIKIIIIAITAFLMVSIFFNLQTINSKAIIQRERDKLSEENMALSEKFEKISKDYRRLEDKTVTLAQDLDAAKREKDEIQGRYEALEKTRQELIERLDSLKTKAEASPAATPALEPADSYWAGILKAKTGLSLQLESIKSELKTLQINNEQLQREKSGLQLEVNNLSLEKQDLKRQLDYNQKQLAYNQNLIDNISLELVGEKNDKTQIKDTFKMIKNENLVLRRQLRNLSSRKISMERKTQELQEQNLQLEKRFNEMDILLKDKLLQVDKLKERIGESKPINKAGEGISSAVELSPIIVRPQQDRLMSAMQQEKTPTLGRVLAINKENNFVIIDLGQDSGIKIGDTFQILRGNETIGSVEVIQVRKAISACDIKKENLPLRIGDTLR